MISQSPVFTWSKSATTRPVFCRVDARCRKTGSKDLFAPEGGAGERGLSYPEATVFDQKEP